METPFQMCFSFIRAQVSVVFQLFILIEIKVTKHKIHRFKHFRVLTHRLLVHLVKHHYFQNIPPVPPQPQKSALISQPFPAPYYLQSMETSGLNLLWISFI